MTGNQMMDYYVNLDTSIHIVRHVLVEDYVEDLPDWWHFIYATSMIMPVFMRF